VDVTGIVDTPGGAGYQGWYVLEQDVMLPGEPDGEVRSPTSGSASTI
jgi:inosose dehydratase